MYRKGAARGGRHSINCGRAQQVGKKAHLFTSLAFGSLLNGMMLGMGYVWPAGSGGGVTMLEMW